MLKLARISIQSFFFSFLLIALVPLSLSEFNPKDIPAPKKEMRSSDKGLYVTYWTTKHKARFNLIKKQAKTAGYNTLVVDIKHILEKQVLPLIKNETMNYEVIVQPDPWLKQLVADLHKEGFIVVGRIVVFKDDHLAIARPDLAIKKKNGTLYRDHKRGRWVDPYSPEVRLYNEYIAEIAAKSGIDEVQFDYIRFPAEGAVYNIKLDYQDNRSRVDIINQFLKDVKNRIKKYKVSLAVDLFGITVWQDKFDIETLGQSLEAMADYIDVVCPMFYPSHFHSGYDGFANPGEHPYYFVNTGVKKAQKILEGKNVKLVPWIQGFALGTNNFGRNYIAQQIKACNDEKVDRFLIWNASNRYNSLPRASSYRSVPDKSQESHQ